MMVPRFTRRQAAAPAAPPHLTQARYDSLLCRVGEAALAARRVNAPAFRDLWDAEPRACASE